MQQQNDSVWNALIRKDLKLCDHSVLMPMTAYDAALRARLKSVRVNQRGLASAAGHDQSWLSKLLGGKGHANIDEFIALARFFPDWKGSLDAFLAKLARDSSSLPGPINPRDVVQTEMERLVLRAFRRTRSERRRKLLDLLEVYARETRQPDPSQSALGSDTPPVTKRKSLGKGQAAG